MAQVYELHRRDAGIPWGFRFQGGSDFGTPLTITKVTPGGLVEKDGIQVGSLLYRIDDIPTHNMTHQQAQQAIIRCCNDLKLEVFSGDSGTYAATQGHTSELKPSPQAIDSMYLPHFKLGASHSNTSNTKATNELHTSSMPKLSIHDSSSTRKSTGELDLMPKPFMPLSASSSKELLAGITQKERGSQPLVDDYINLMPKPFTPHSTPSLRESLNKTSSTHSPVNEYDSVTPKPFMTQNTPSSEVVLNKGTRQGLVKQYSLNKLAPKPLMQSSTLNSNESLGTERKTTIPQAQAKSVQQSQSRESIPICHHCKAEIHGPFVDTVDYCFCQNHFNCQHCGKPLLNIQFAEVDGKFYCANDFLELVATKCAKCLQPITDTTIKALNKSWHPRCFACAKCNRPLDSKFYAEDSNTVYCEKHWQEMHFKPCAACKKNISEIENFVEAIGKTFHTRCFCCAACQAPLEGKPFHTRHDRPFCPEHARSVALFN